MFLKSSTVAMLGKFTVLDIAPDISGVRAATILTWPSGAMYLSPVPQRLAVSKIARCSSFR